MVILGNNYTDLGCWQDYSSRAIPPLERKDSTLKGHYWARGNAFQKCADAARNKGYSVFALQHGGWCASSRDAGCTYFKYGESDKCKDGTGAGWTNSVYMINSPADTGSQYTNSMANFYVTMVTSHDVTRLCTRYFDSFHKNEFMQRSCKTDGQVGKVNTIICAAEFQFTNDVSSKFFQTTMLNHFIITTQFYLISLKII